MTTVPPIKKYSMALLLSLFGVANAEEVAELQDIDVVSKAVSQKQGEIKKNREAILEEMIADTRDLVRYTTDVGVADSGRHLKGFAMRGVEGNRVGISIDGVNLPDYEENSLYARYGNFNSSRLTIDPELVRGIDIVRGADSFTTGSGALGGGVNYKTLDAADIVQPENRFGVLLKNSYASKNREWIHTAGIGYKGEQLDAVYLYSTRYGHELKSLSTAPAAWNNSSGQPDPSFHRNHSNLVKIGYLFNDNHRLSASYSNQLNNNFIIERSFNNIDVLWRESEDIGERHNANLAYEYFPTSGWLAYFKADYDFQKTDVQAVNYRGSHYYGTDIKQSLDEIYDRNMKNTFHRLSLQFDSQPWEARLGTHKFNLKTAASIRKFENENFDTYFSYSSGTVSTVPSSIQHPVKNQAFYVAVQDAIQWNDWLASNVGVRYDQEKLQPQSLKYTCNACDPSVKPNTFKNLTGSAGINAQLSPAWNLGYYLSSGYRTPSASEMYFTYKHPAGNWLANPYLKAERSVNHSINLKGENALGTLNLNLYQQRYKDFLVEQETNGLAVNSNCDAYCRYYGFNPVNPTVYMQAVNIDRAKISGLELSSTLNLNQVAGFLPQGLSFIANLGYSKGKLYGTEASLLSIQPMKVILGLSYEDPNGDWGVHGRWSYLAAKKAKDAQIITYAADRTTRLVKPFSYLNGSASLFDLYGFTKIGKHVTLRAGVYNLFNRKYQTWDSLRGINLIGTSNTVDREGKGLQRFIAPGRNFAASVELKF